jgi:hypothetical protein
VRADESLHLGSITILLDCTDSMRQSLKNGKQTKMAQAREALNTVLGKVPKGTRLSLWAYGMRTGPENSGPEKRAVIRQIQAPVIWDPEKDPNQRRNLIAEVTKLEPMNWTPLVQTMLRAKEELAPHVGMKTLVVLTDGYDNLFEPELDEARRRQRIRETLRQQFTARENIVISMLLLGDADDKVVVAARHQFRETILNLPIKGNWYEAASGEDLPEQLLRAVRPHLRLLQINDPVPDLREGFKITQSDERGNHWSALTLAGKRRNVLYTALVQNLRKDIALDPGDNMLIMLKPRADGGVRFQRGLFEDAYRQHKFYGRHDHGDWRLSIWRNRHLSGTNELDILMSLEDRRDISVEPEILRQPRRGFMWLEQTAGGQSQPGLRWETVWNYPGPAWKLNHLNWPRSADGRHLLPPELSVWWDPNPNPDPQNTISHDDRTKRFEDELRGQERALVNSKVTIESVEVDERHPVPGNPEGTPCLVVRLAHELDRPVWVQLSGVEAEGSEHRFYDKPGKVTAVFWPVSRDVAQSGFTLNLISLAEFRKKAPHRADAKDLNLSTPTVGSGPDPVK